jgi:fused signal recognition particle receptor
VFWRRKPKEEEAEEPSAEEAAAGQASTVTAPTVEAPAESEDVPPGWEPDPRDFDDPLLTGRTPPVEPEVAELAVADRAASATVVGGPVPGWISPDDSAPGDLVAGLEKSRTGFVGRLRGFLGAGPAGPSWDDVEETLIAGDVGASLAMDIVERARARRDPGGPEAAVRAELAALLLPRAPGEWRPAVSRPGSPAVILVIGVNGTGKTTTIGKLASRYRDEGLTVLLAAADTFRAAAIEQLTTWAQRSGAQIVAHAPGADPGAVVFDALDAAVARGIDVVIADTAGRLHTKVNLMDELAKVRRIVDKRLPGAKPETLFVLDATTGQNGLAQALAFHEAVGLTGVVLTKLDSTSKGGIVFAIEDALKVPVRFVGVGEKVGDLLPFDPDAFVAALFA